MRAVFATAVLAMLALPADAGRYVVQRGETLEHVAKAHGCKVDAIMRANGVDTTLLKAGTVIRIPPCNDVRTRRATRTVRRAVVGSADERARLALAVIDGTSVVRAQADPPDSRDSGDSAGAAGAAGAAGWSHGSAGADDGMSRSVGSPTNGRLVGGERLREGEGYRIRRPHRAYGAAHVVEHLRVTVAAVRALYPDVHTLAIGDLSARHGGKIGDHLSHQSGLDVDIGFYFDKVPDGYPDRFVAANDDLDLDATWALLTAFARTSHLPDGVAVIFLDEGVQERLHRWARKRGVPDSQLGEILQYPRPRDSLAGIVRHWPNHADHMHVRFKAAP